MTITENDWIDRIADRMDLCAQVTHFTRAATINGDDFSAIEILIKILRERRIIGSNTSSGFIVGNRSAVCFQESPVISMAQIFRKTGQRYTGTGLMFKKPYVFRKKGRPVFYDQTQNAKLYLTESNWWRIVNFSLHNSTSFIDWTHEREWRVPDDFGFDIAQATVVVPGTDRVEEFLEKSANNEGEDVAKLVKAIIPLSTIRM